MGLGWSSCGKMKNITAVFVAFWATRAIYKSIVILFPFVELQLRQAGTMFSFTCFPPLLNGIT